MLIEQLIGFAEFLREHNAQSTRNGYTTRARSYLRTLPDDAAFTESNVRAYIYRMGDRLRPATCHSALSAISKFGVWCVDQGLLGTNPAANVKPPKPDTPRRETPTEAQVTGMMEACECINSPYRKALARAVVYSLAMSALRRFELLALKLGDVDVSDGAIYVRHGKGNRARTVRPGAACIGALRDYLAERPECRADRLFLVRKGQFLGDEGLRTLLRDVAAIAGLQGNKAILPHGLRHACATRLRLAGVELEEISEYLGHSDVKTTILYLHRPTERMREIAPLTDPRTARAHTPAPAPPAAPDPAPVRRPNLRLVDGGAQRQPGGTQ